VVDFFFHEEAGAGTAALALGEEQAEVGAFRGRVETGGGEDNVRGLAAGFGAAPVQIALGRGRLAALTGWVRTLAAYFVHFHVAVERRTGRGTVTGNDVQYAVREADVLSELCHAKGGQRRLLGRLQHNGATGRQRRAPFPRLHQ